MTASEGDALRKDIETLKQQRAVDIYKSKESTEKLKQVLEQATALLTRNSADVGALVERLQTDVNRLNGQIEEIKKTLNDLEKKINDLDSNIETKIKSLTHSPPTPSSETPLPQDKNQLFALAKSQLDAGKFKEGRSLLKTFLSKYTDDPNAAQAQLLLGDSYYKEEKLAPAIQEYRKIIENYKESPIVPDALFQIGMSFYQLKYCSDAALFFNAFIKGHKDHSKSPKVRQILNLIKKYKSNSSFCSS